MLDLQNSFRMLGTSFHVFSHRVAFEREFAAVRISYDIAWFVVIVLRPEHPAEGLWLHLRSLRSSGLNVQLLRLKVPSNSFFV